MSTEKSLEQKLRRTLRAAGYELHKSRVRNIHLDDLGGYCISRNNWLVAGERFQLTLSDVAEWAEGLAE